MRYSVSFHIDFIMKDIQYLIGSKIDIEKIHTYNRQIVFRSIVHEYNLACKCKAFYGKCACGKNPFRQIETLMSEIYNFL